MSLVTERRRDVLSTMMQLVGLVLDLPGGAEVTIEWADAPVDLVLLLALQDDGELRSSQAGGRQTDEAEWKCGGVVFRARRSHPVTPKGQAKLMLVRS